MQEDSVSVNVGSLSMARSQGLTIAWKDLGYSVIDRTTKEKKSIMHSMQGFAEPGSMVAILGASGAGKSTFLDSLAGRKDPAFLSGQVLINGRTDVPMKHVSRYCTQEDALFGSLTVYETLCYAVRFNMSKNISREKRDGIVMYLLKEFGLESVKDTIIGTPLIKGCSGGQVRRVSAAAQVVGVDGDILFFDEPTSGLDSVAASSVVSSIKSLAMHKNCTVLATIHQPSTDTFNLFSHLLVMGLGTTVYFGPREEALEHFAKIGHPVPTYSNPSDFYLQLTNIDFLGDRETGKKKVQELISVFGSSERARANMNAIEHLATKEVVLDESKLGYTNGYAYQSQVLISRALLNAAKNPLAYWIRVAMYVCLAILMGTTWLRMGEKQSTVQDRLSACFFSVAFLAFMSVAGIPAFLEERHVYLRERGNGLYSVESYVLANFIISIPFIFIITISFSLVAYFLMGFQSDVGRFWSFVAYLFLALMVAEAQTVFVSVAIPIFVAALAITSFVNGMWMVVQGYFVQRKNIPKYYRYSLHYIDFYKYAFELLVKNELEGRTFNCEKKIMNGVQSCFCLIPPVERPYDPCHFTGKDVLRYYGYTDIKEWAWVIILIGLLLAYKLGMYLILKTQKAHQ